MQLFTSNLYQKLDVIDDFESIVWTERYYGDSDTEIVVPISSKLVKTWYPGMFVGLEESDELLRLETFDRQGSTVKFNGISILSWLNNRFIRTSKYNDVQSYTLTGLSPGEAIFALMLGFVSASSPYLDGTIDIGIVEPERFMLPDIGLDVGDWYDDGTNLNFEIPFGPLFDAMQEIAKAYKYGIQILRNRDPLAVTALRFRNYIGADRSGSPEEASATVRFSEKMESLANVEELRSSINEKNVAFAFATQVPNMQQCGEAKIGDHASWDLRAILVFDNEITAPNFKGLTSDYTDLMPRLGAAASIVLGENKYIEAVGGDVVETVEHEFGNDYYLGDVVQFESKSGIISKARVTEYIRTQDQSGERHYPGFEMIPDTIVIPTPPTPPPPPADPGPSQNFSMIGEIIGMSRDITQTVPLVHDVIEDDGILVVAMAPSNPLSGDPLGIPTSCTDTAGNTYNIIHQSKFEAASPVENEGAVVTVFSCETTIRPLLHSTDTITVTWTNSVFDRAIVAWLMRREPTPAYSPTVLGHTSDNNTTVKASTQMTLTVPTWTPIRNNSFEFALLVHLMGLTDSGAYGGVSGYDGFYEATNFNFLGSKQRMPLHWQSYGAAVDIHAEGSTHYETDTGSLPGGIAVPSFNGVAQNYAVSGHWKGIILLGMG